MQPQTLALCVLSVKLNDYFHANHEGVVSGESFVTLPIDVLFFCGPNCLFFREDTERVDRVRVLTDADACFTGAVKVDVDCGWLFSGALVLLFKDAFDFFNCAV
jgi:hypothetical protein